MPVPSLIDLVAHTRAKAADVMANFNSIVATLDPDSGASGGIDGSNMKRGAPGQIWVAGAGAGTFVRRLLSGDGTINSSGIFRLEDGVVDSPQLVGNAATSPKVQLTTHKSVLANDIQIGAGSFTDLCSVPVVDGIYLVLAQVALDDNGASRNVHLSLQYNGSDHEDGDRNFGTTQVVPYNDIVTITSGATLKLRAKDAGVSGTFVRSGGWTRMLAIWIGN